MGTSCTNCKDADHPSLMMDIGDMANMYDFSQSTWPNHPPLMKLLQNSEIAKGEPKLKPFKHAFYQRYYWGGWSQNRPKGKGIYYVCDDAKRVVYYQGEVDGQPNGKGKFVVNFGEWEYQGMVNKGQAHGEGKMVSRKDGYQFEGQWRNSKPYKGRVVLYGKNQVSSNESKRQARQSNETKDQKDTNNQSNITSSTKVPSKTIIQIDTQNPESIITYPDGRIYRGPIDQKRFIPHGTGKVTLPDKSQYIGEWHQGQMHGTGRFSWPDGSSYIGDYMFGKKHGNGKFIYSNGRSYQGGWAEGKQHGHGTITGKDGQILKKGVWKYGEFVPK